MAKIKLIGSAPADFTLMGTLNNLCITIIPTYAALIVLPLTISVVHYSKIYPLLPLSEILTKKITSIFIIYFIILIVCAAELFFIGRLNSDTPSSNILFILSILFITLFVPLIQLWKRLIEILSLSPYMILQIIGYPNGLKILFNKNDFEGLKMKYRQGLSLVRSCILDLAFREYLNGTADLFGKSIKVLPWFETNIEKNQETRLMDFLINSLDEYIIAPLKDTKYLPDPYDLQPILIIITDVLYKLEFYLRKMDLQRSGSFERLLDKLYQLIYIYAKEGKLESIGAFYIGIFRNRIADSSPSVEYLIISSMLTGLASLAEAPIKGKFSSENSTYITDIFDMAKNRPYIFSRFRAREVDALRTIINVSDDFILGKTIIFLMFAKDEISKEQNEDLKNKALQNFVTIKYFIEQKLAENNLGLGINIEMKGLAIIHFATATPAMSGIGTYIDADLKLMQECLNSEFRGYTYNLTKEKEPGTYSISSVVR